MLLMDLGGWTVDLMRIDNAIPVADTAHSLELGMIRCVDDIREQVRRETELSLTDAQIQFSVNDLSPIKIDMVDLTVVIGNTLDNAIEACEKLPETDRQIYVQALLEEDELFYAIRNKSLPVNMIANQLPASTKENPSFHGYGLQNVHTTLEKYHTLYAMDYENGWFEFATELPNTLIS